MLKRTVSFILIFFLFSFRAYALSADEVSAECAVLMTVQGGNVIFSKNEHQRHSMASTTKIMTSLIAVESGRLSDIVTVTDKMAGVEGTSMGLKSGDKVSLKALVYGMMLPSGNDAANSCAIYLGGSSEAFSDMMNRKALEIGMTESNFVTPSGLDDEEHYSTAYDMALLGREAVKNPVFLDICSTEKITLSYGNPPYDRTLYNHNRLLSSYEGAMGIKTGFTKKSGRCLVSCAFRDGVGLIAVTLNDGDDWNDHRRMLDYGFSQVVMNDVDLNIPESVKLVGGDIDRVKITSENYRVENTVENIEVRCFIPEFIYAPVKFGQVIGEAKIYLDGKYCESVPITVSEDADYKEIEISQKSFTDKIKEFFHD